MILKFVIFAACAFLLYRMFMNDRRKKEERRLREKTRRVADGELVRDPECGTFIDRDSAVTVRNGDQVSYFCSHECRARYLEKARALDEPR